MSLTPSPSGIKLAQAVGITGAALLSGTILSFTFLTVPALLAGAPAAPPAALAAQWARLYARGAALVPTGAAGVALAFFVLARAARAGARRAYAGAGLALLCHAPYTLLVMGRTNDALHRAAAAAGGGGADVEALLVRWGRLNVARALFALGAAGLGAWAAL